LYAIIKSGGKQYRVTEGATVEVERLAGDVGQEVEFQDVLFANDDNTVAAGNPSVSGARVVGTIVAHKRGDKVLVFKFKKTKMYRKLQGHRQNLSEVTISRIELPQKDQE